MDSKYKVDSKSFTGRLKTGHPGVKIAIFGLIKFSTRRRGSRKFEVGFICIRLKRVEYDELAKKLTSANRVKRAR